MSDLLPDGPAARYLDELADRLPGPGRAIRRTLAEVEDHLAEATVTALAGGLDQTAAEEAAVERFGAAREVAREMSSVDGWRLSPALVRQVVSALVFIGALGLVAIGVSGLVAAGEGAAFGTSFVSGDSIGVTYTPARCAQFREYYPGEPTCEAAATAHHYDEVVGYRIDAGVLGVLALGGWLLATRRRRRRTGSLWPALPDGFVPTIGSALSGTAAAALLLLSLGQLAMGYPDGTGDGLSAGLVASMVFAGFVIVLWRTLRRRSVDVT